MKLTASNGTLTLTNDEWPLSHSFHSPFGIPRSMSAFSRTEILSLLVLFGVLVWLMTPKFGGITDPPDGFAMADIKGGLKTAMDRYEIETRQYPHSLQDLVMQPSGVTNWKGPYLDSLPNDPWGHPYGYAYPGQKNTTSYDLYSLGRDGQAGTSDDIGNWKNK